MTFKTSTLVIALLVLMAVCAVVGYFVHRNTESYATLLAMAQAHNAQLKIDRDKYQKIATTEALARVEADKKEKVVTKTIVIREKDTATAESAVTAPASATATKQADFVKKYYNFTPTVQGDNLLFSVPQTTKVVTTKIERDAYEKDKVDLKKVLFEEQEKTKSLTYELNQTKDQLKKTQNMSEEWSHVAHKSKGRKILDGVVKGLEIGGVGIVAYEIGAHH